MSDKAISNQVDADDLELRLENEAEPGITEDFDAVRTRSPVRLLVSATRSKTEQFGYSAPR